MTYKRRYTTHYNDREQSWYIRDNHTGHIIEAGYTQYGARQAAHYHNYRHDPKGYPKRNQRPA